MKIKVITKIVLKNLLQNRIKSGLIIFSIIVGVCSLFILFSINETGKNEILKTIKEKGNASIVQLDIDIYTNKRVGTGERPVDNLVGQILETDLRVLKNSCSEIDHIACEGVQHVGPIKIGNKQYPPENASRVVAPYISGINPEYKDVRSIKLKEGRFINKTDLLYKRRVCVIGGMMYERLGKGKVIGEKLIVKKTQDKFTIVGVMKKNMPLFTSLTDNIQDKLTTINSLAAGRKASVQALNDGVYIPLTTWKDFAKKIEIPWRLIASINPQTLTNLPPSPPSPIPTWIYIKLNIPEEGRLIEDEEGMKIYPKESGIVYLPNKVKPVVDKMRNVLRKRFGEDKLFGFFYCGKLANEIHDQIEDSNKLLGITGFVALLLSGIIISSTMLMSVHNRVSEIGIRRALGARKRDIFYQFLAEGVVIYSIGIVFGLVAGVILSYLLIVKLLSWEYSIPIYSLVLSSLIPFLIGILSSLYPAMQAAKIQSAIAVKYE